MRTARMIQFYINRAGKNLPESRKCERRKAIRLMQDMDIIE